MEAGRHAAGQLQHRGRFARDVLGVEDQQFTGVGRRGIDQSNDVAIAFRRGGRTRHEDRLVRRIARVELRIGSVAVIGAGQRVRDTAHDLHLEVVLAAHWRKHARKVGMDGLGIGHVVLLDLYSLNLSLK
jgi:hypothetical protein